MSIYIGGYRVPTHHGQDDEEDDEEAFTGKELCVLFAGWLALLGTAITAVLWALS